MRQPDTTFKIPIWRQTPGSRRDSSRIQLNPASAIAQSDAKLALKTWAVTGSMLAVLALILVGGMTTVRQKQKTSVEASLNLKRSLVGLVTHIESSNNAFTIRLQSSLDPKILQSQREEWTIQLPPGESFEIEKRFGTIPACFITEDIRKSLVNASAADCSEIVQVGQEILIEYLILKPEDQTIIAKTVVGQ